MMQTKKSLIRYYAPALVGLLIIIVLLAPSHHTTLSGKSSLGRYHVHAQLWTVLLRDIYVRTLGRSSELHLPAQPALSETNADRRLSGGTCPDAFRLHMGRTTVQSK